MANFVHVWIIIRKFQAACCLKTLVRIIEIRALNKVSTSLSPQLRQKFLVSSNMPTMIKFSGHLMNIILLLARRQLLATCAVVSESWGSVLRCPHHTLYFTASHPLHMNRVMWQEAHTLPMTCASCNWTCSNLQVCLWCYRLNKTTGMQNTYWNEKFYRKKRPSFFLPLARKTKRLGLTQSTKCRCFLNHDAHKPITKEQVWDKWGDVNTDWMLYNINEYLLGMLMALRVHVSVLIRDEYWSTRYWHKITCRTFLNTSGEKKSGLGVKGDKEGDRQWNTIHKIVGNCWSWCCVHGGFGILPVLVKTEDFCNEPFSQERQFKRVQSRHRTGTP